MFLVKIDIYSKRSQARSFRDIKGEELEPGGATPDHGGTPHSPFLKGDVTFLWSLCLLARQETKQILGGSWFWLKSGEAEPQELLLVPVTMDIYILSHVCSFPSCCASLNFICNTVDPIALSLRKSVARVLWDTETAWFVTWPCMLLLMKKKGCKGMWSKRVLEFLHHIGIQVV